ncbi:hypothetical protein SAMN05444266_105229 [Chitinophaga jiangningensis]|uniref:Uncharacterized protein n=1 Tax=Chitinophaga jiangningensis TaxID=1419482 RepID=A0A1M7E0Z1_9BACT|nr:hypothetical protein [Chitinophaga jiangningensis]SHL85421.1 hypothetical protein SAMN05444266_105229 [Chitinophaga jiangningensis]
MALPVHLQETAEWASQTFELRIPGHVSYETLQQLLAERLKTLINTDFQQFVFLLYRIDVSEKKVQAIISEANAAQAEPYNDIAALIIERQLQKIATRAHFRQQPPEDDEEKW